MTERVTQHPPGEAPHEEEAVSLLWAAAILLRERRVVMAFTAAGLLVSLVIALLRPRTYTTVFSFVPQGQEQAPSGLASLAGQFGISLANVGSPSESPQLYADLLVTKEVLAPIAADSVDPGDGAGTAVPLSEFLHVRGKNHPTVLEYTMRALRKKVISTTVASRTTGMVTVRVRTQSASVSEEIAQRLLEGLNHFNLVTRQSRARQERKFTEGRLTDARASLSSAEDSLLRFLQHNREFNTPELTFQRDRLERAVTFRQEIVTALAQQYEQDRTREVRDTPVITVIEQPTRAPLPNARLRIVILVLGLVAGGLLGTLAAMARDAWAREVADGSNPALAFLVQEWRRVRRVTRS